MPTSDATRTAEQTLADLRRKLRRWEENLTTNARKYERGTQEYFSANTQLGLVQDLLKEIGR